MKALGSRRDPDNTRLNTIEGKKKDTGLWPLAAPELVMISVVGYCWERKHILLLMLKVLIKELFLWLIKGSIYSSNVLFF